MKTGKFFYETKTFQKGEKTRKDKHILRMNLERREHSALRSGEE